MINLSHIRSTTQSNNTAVNNTQENCKSSRIISLSHLKSNSDPDKPVQGTSTVVVNSTTEEITALSSSSDEENPESSSSIRIRPNSKFLRRYVGGVEKSNEKLSIIAPVVDIDNVEDKAGIIEELKVAALEKVKNQPKTLEELRKYQMEGELKIQQLAEAYNLSVQVTYLPFIPPMDSAEVITPLQLPPGNSNSGDLRSKAKKKREYLQKLRVVKASFSSSVTEQSDPPRSQKTLDLTSTQSTLLLKGGGRQNRPISGPIAQEAEEKDRKRPRLEQDSSTSPSSSQAATRTQVGQVTKIPYDTPPPAVKPPKKLFSSAFKFLSADPANK